MPYPTTAPAPNRRTGGFTLIELLVVIAIIAILAAILFPVFAKAREKARQTACLSNQKQIGLGLLQYVQDNDEMLPYSFYGNTGNESNAASGLYKWMDAIYPYVKSEAVFNCPDQAFPNSANVLGYRYYLNQASDATHRYYGSYGLNAMYRYEVASANRWPPASRPFSAPTSVAAIGVPAGTIWVVDNNDTSGGSTYQFGWSCLASGGGCTSTQPSTIINTTVTPNKIDTMEARHTDRANVMYCDGHAKSVTLGSLATDVAADGKTLRQFTIQDD